MFDIKAVKDTDISTMSFKEASIALEQIVRALEGGELELEESLEYYTLGIELLKSLRERVASAELRVSELADKAGVSVSVDTVSAPAAPNEG